MCMTTLVLGGFSPSSTSVLDGNRGVGRPLVGLFLSRQERKKTDAHNKGG